MEDVLGPVICRICCRSGPGVGELIALHDGLEAETLKAGWRYRTGWICPGCAR